MDVHERSTMDPVVKLTQKIEVEPPTQGGDWHTQTGLNTETVTHEPVEEQTQSTMDTALASTPKIEAETTDQVTQVRDWHTQIEKHSALNTETLTHEPVDVQTQSDMDATVAQTQKIEIETLNPLGDAETLTSEETTTALFGVAAEATKVETPTQSGDAELHTQDHTDLQKDTIALLQAASAISEVSADSSPEVLAQILQERWQEKETDIQCLREELTRTTEEKTTAQAQVKNLITAACSITKATEDSTPADAAENLRDAREALDVWRSKTKATWNKRLRTMKNKMALQIETLADPIRLITGSTSQTPKVLVEKLRQAWDQVQGQNDDLDLDLKTANDRVKQLAIDVGVCLTPGINHTDVVAELKRSFENLKKGLQDREQQRLAAHDSITVKNEEIKDLKTKMESMTSSLENLQLLVTESKKKGKKFSRKLRLRWWKRTPEQGESKIDLEQMQKDLIKKSATISVLEAKLTTMADQVKKLVTSEKREKCRLGRQKAARTGLQNDIKLLQFDNNRKETLIQSLRDLVETLKKNCLRKNRRAARYRVRNTIDHVTVASMPTIKCELLSVDNILPFSGCQKPGDHSNMQVLGKGTYGKVYLGRYGNDLRPIAIKQPMLPDGYDSEMVKEEMLLMKGRARKESMVQQLLSGSPYFPKMIGMVTIGEDLCTVMDFIGNMNTGKTYPLYQALTRFMPNPRLDLINMLQVCEDIIKGMMELHQNGYLHNDLKSNNVLLEKRSQRWHAVIIDLGLVSTMAYSKEKQFSDEKRAEYRAGRGLYFLAPEVVLYGERYSVASDIFSFGILLKSIAKKIHVDEVAELAETCTKQDPLKRPHTMQEILHKMEAISDSH